MESTRKNDELPEVFKLVMLRDACRKFMYKTKICCSEDIYKMDWDVEESYILFDRIGEIIGYYGQER